jgi:hypothetical protein
MSNIDQKVRVASAHAGNINTLVPVEKSNPDVFVMQSAEDWAAKNTPALSTGRDRGESLFKDRCVRVSL